ncbi:hypothetical protein B0H13DRAFT_1876852 [Mycena leptocephala]|nr:hypothetical protein B0H13DRAFT_1876852 [Mycena leptocephala]
MQLTTFLATVLCVAFSLPSIALGQQNIARSVTLSFPMNSTSRRRAARRNALARCVGGRASRNAFARTSCVHLIRDVVRRCDGAIWDVCCSRKELSFKFCPPIGKWMKRENIERILI